MVVDSAFTHQQLTVPGHHFDEHWQSPPSDDYSDATQASVSGLRVRNYRHLSISLIRATHCRTRLYLRATLSSPPDLCMFRSRTRTTTTTPVDKQPTTRSSTMPPINGLKWRSSNVRGASGHVRRQTRTRRTRIQPCLT